MSGHTDQLKGRIKQAIGALSGDRKLQRKGRNDERAGRSKQHADHTFDLARDKLDKVASAPTPKSTDV